MAFSINSKDFAEYMQVCANEIKAHKNIIAQLEQNREKDYGWAELGDAFEYVSSSMAALENVQIYVMLRNMGLLLMGHIGSDSAMLFGSSYISASRCIEGKETLNCRDIHLILDAMCKDMMKRTKTKPGRKSIIDSIYPAVRKMMICLEIESDDLHILSAAKKAALNGAMSTKETDNKTALCDNESEDAGAYVMALRIACLCDFISEKLIQKI